MRQPIKMSSPSQPILDATWRNNQTSLFLVQGDAPCHKTVTHLVQATITSINWMTRRNALVVVRQAMPWGAVLVEDLKEGDAIEVERSPIGWSRDDYVPSLIIAALSNIREIAYEMGTLVALSMDEETTISVVVAFVCDLEFYEEDGYVAHIQKGGKCCDGNETEEAG